MKFLHTQTQKLVDKIEQQSIENNQLQFFKNKYDDIKKEREEKEMEYKNDLQRKQNQIIVLKNNSELLQK